MSGMCRSTKPDRLFFRGTKNKKHNKGFNRREYDDLPHPCPRRLEHVKWLVYQFSDKSVVDPFAGSCTTGLACKELGRKCICIEKVEAHCELGASRMAQEVLGL
jgi:DNA modification methylase